MVSVLKACLGSTASVAFRLLRGCVTSPLPSVGKVDGVPVVVEVARVAGFPLWSWRELNTQTASPAITATTSTAAIASAQGRCKASASPGREGEDGGGVDSGDSSP